MRDKPTDIPSNTPTAVEGRICDNHYDPLGGCEGVYDATGICDQCGRAPLGNIGGWATWSEEGVL